MRIVLVAWSYRCRSPHRDHAGGLERRYSGRIYQSQGPARILASRLCDDAGRGSGTRDQG